MKPNNNLNEDGIIEDETDELSSDISTYSFGHNAGPNDVTIHKTYNTIIEPERYTRSTKIIFGYAALWFMLMAFLIFILWNHRTKTINGYVIHIIFFVMPMLAVIAYIVRQMYFMLR